MSTAVSRATATGRREPAVRRLLLVPGGCALLAGLDAALTLAGLPAPVNVTASLGDHGTSLADLHGPLMVIGFLGTVIALERAVAARASWAYLAPGLLGAGAIAVATLPDPLLGRLLMLQGAALLVVVYGALWRRNNDLTVGVEALGGVALAAAALMLLRVPVAATLPLLLAFVVATIAAERVELARLAMPAGAGARLLALSAPLVACAAASLLWPAVAGRLVGLTLAVLTAWLVRHDVARRTVHATGLPRFAAVALLAGYAWLALAAVTLVASGAPGEGTSYDITAYDITAYDIVVHATFLGFAMSMVMAHAPVILPAVLGVRLPYRPVMYAPLALLHLGLVARLLVGHLPGAAGAWAIGAATNVAALLFFVVVAAGVAIHAHLSRPTGTRP